MICVLWFWTMHAGWVQNRTHKKSTSKRCTYDKCLIYTAPAKGKKKRGRKPKNAVTAAAAVASEEDETEDGENKKGKGSPAMAKEPPAPAAPPPAAATAWRQPPSSSSFQQYRRAGDMGEMMTSVVIESLYFIVRRNIKCAQSLPLTYI